MNSSSSITTDNDENKNKKKNFNKGMQIKQYYDNDLKISGEGFFFFFGFLKRIQVCSKNKFLNYFENQIQLKISYLFNYLARIHNNTLFLMNCCGNNPQSTNIRRRRKSKLN